MKDRLLIFDMDNTLLHSRIDFALMKQEVGRLLEEADITFDYQRPVSDNLSVLQAQGVLFGELYQRIWNRIGEIENIGLQDALLEPGVEWVLAQLSQKVALAVLSNNMDHMVHKCLHQLGVDHYFELICGREAVPALKPCPEGIGFMLDFFPQIVAAQTWMIGDALIDAKASRGAGIGFIAYNRSRDENWLKLDRAPELYLKGWDDTAVAKILELIYPGVCYGW
ncbi:MAG: HAD hydrolase-like protein [Clostridiales bacterium]